MTHCLKTWPNYYNLVKSGVKTFEIRKFDRPFITGDKLILQEWNPDSEEYTGAELEMIILSVFIGYDTREFGPSDGFCILSISPYPKSDY